MIALYDKIPFEDIKIVTVYQDEAELIKEKGWNAFEDFLEKNEIDNLWDLNREPYIW